MYDELRLVGYREVMEITGRSRNWAYKAIKHIAGSKDATVIRLIDLSAYIEANYSPKKKQVRTNKSADFRRWEKINQREILGK